MNEQALEPKKTPCNSQQTAKRNRGSFQPGDPRINRAGRPKGAEALARRAKAGRPLGGPIKILVVPLSHFRARLADPRGTWVINLPGDWRIVACELDLSRSELLLTIYSEWFAVVQAGEPIPEFRPEYNGLKWV